MNLKVRAKKLKLDIPVVFIALKQKDTPILAKIFASLTIAYALSPIDLIPDFIPVLGYLDDIILIPFFIALTVKMIPKEILNECRVEAEGLWDNGKPQKWYFAVPVVLLWIVIAATLIKTIWF